MLDLPRKDKDGKCYVSYSQFTSWYDLKSFSLGVEGRVEYMIGYFFGHRFPDAGWGQFGAEVEDYICEKKGPENFSVRELAFLSEIEPLGKFQVEVRLPIVEDVYLLGYIDDAEVDFSRIRDYKTGSLASTRKYYKDTYKQLVIYAAWVEYVHGFLPVAEVCAIERVGSCYGMTERRDLLSVGDNVWWIEQEITPKRVAQVKSELVSFVYELSAAYSVFKKLNKIL